MSEAAEGNNTATWRLDPEESYSDWKIEVVTDEGTIVYCVHKCLLATGPRKSEYFAGVFRHAGSLLECTSSTLSLEKRAADFFPDFLDYVYTGLLGLNEKNVAVLCHLGNYFGVRPLCKVTEKFMDSKINANNLAVFLPDILLFRDSVPKDIAVIRCAQVWLMAEFYPHECMDECMDYEFVLEVMKICGDVVQSRDSFTPTKNEAVSWKVLDWIGLYDGNLDKSRFLELTDKKILPNISPGAALKYLQIHESINGAMGDTSCLLKRCVCAITESRSSSSMLVQPQVAAAMSSLSQPVLADLLVSSMYCNKHPEEQYYKGPHCIIVKGSSYSGLNGIFHKEEKTYNLFPKYSKDADEGASYRFMIVHFKGEKRWSIVIAQKDPENESHWIAEDTLYTAFDDSSKYPPAWGWHSCSRAEHKAPPVLLFRREDQHQSDVE